MGIRGRTEDAEALWQLGRREGAWVMALIAADATARKRYPDLTNNRERFTSFLRDIMPTVRTGKTSPDAPNPQIIFDQTPLEDVFYTHLRNHLIHEAETSQQHTVFSESEAVDGKLQATLSVGTPNQLPDFWVLNLVKAVREAPENSDEFG